MSKIFASQADLEGYVVAAKLESFGDLYKDKGFAILVKSNREFTPTDRNNMHEAIRQLEYKFDKETLNLDPTVHEKALNEKNALIVCFQNVGAIYVEETPNEYHNPTTSAFAFFKPWYIVTTRVGRIKIGWRKSVIHIGWTDSAVKKTAKEIFPQEEAWPGYQTTQYDQVIHAHGLDKAAEYINRVVGAYETK